MTATHPVCGETVPGPASLCLHRVLGGLDPGAAGSEYSREGEARTAAALDGAAGVVPDRARNHVPPREPRP